MGGERHTNTNDGAIFWMNFFCLDCGGAETEDGEDGEEKNGDSGE